ncbi:PD-(D/E)XK nuclease family protein [Hymenobacter artigasi]|uniref:PD-(D/E)XK nuclease family protein n=1 Tax=Hymenobacter artigasi TaxID=2719616 RepID=A0ABX1HL07_9BACT|nr:PD-(D/E)XK nuclease family protein [Hymenobacter artigasi]NKI90490.1 hypothetical protein [Hymenobacter artigasi]
MLSLPELAAFLQNAHWPQIQERRPTFFSIAGFPHYENVMSNVYQFFFSTESPHDLGSLCMDALGDVIQGQSNIVPWPENEFRRTHARRELRTDNDKRLDILLHNGSDEDEWQSASTLVLIENKVYHWLANDLGEYWQFAGKQNPSCTRIGIVLGLKREDIPEPWQKDWIAVTHLEWAQAIEKRLGAYIYRAESRYVTLLLELIENIRHMSATENFQQLQFFQQNRAAIFQAEQIRRDAFLQFPEALRQSLPGYDMAGSKSESNQGWLVIYRRGSNRFKYVLSYYELFHEGTKTPTYRIQLVGASVPAEEAQKTQATLLTEEHSQYRHFEVDDNNPHHVLTKTYPLQSSSSKPLHEIIITSLKDDWQPLEKLWLNQPET